MALDKLVDSAQLNADLTSVANAIRTKGGTSASLAFPSGFVSAIEAIPTGGGGDELFDDFLDGTSIAMIKLDNITKLRTGAIAYAENISAAHFVNVTEVSNRCVSETKNLTTIVFEKPISTLYSRNLIFYNNQNLTIADLNTLCGGSGGADFQNCSRLTTIILRSMNLVPLRNTSVIATNTPFKSGGTGGTIYIPKALYDELGTGSSLDYKAATNWSTVDGYGTITWAQIEGSIYETQYADGTPIT